MTFLNFARYILDAHKFFKASTQQHNRADKRAPTLPFYFPYRGGAPPTDIGALIERYWDKLQISHEICSTSAPKRARASLVSNSFVRLLDVDPEVPHILDETRAELARVSASGDTSDVNQALIEDLEKRIGVMEAYLRFVDLPAVKTANLPKFTGLAAAQALSSHRGLRKQLRSTISHVLIDDVQHLQPPFYNMLMNLIKGRDKTSAPCLIAAGDQYQTRLWNVGNDIVTRMHNDLPHLQDLHLRHQHRSDIDILYSGLAPIMTSEDGPTALASMWRHLPCPAPSNTVAPRSTTTTTTTSPTARDSAATPTPSSTVSTTATSDASELLPQAAIAPVSQLPHCIDYRDELDAIALDIQDKWCDGERANYTIGVLVRATDTLNEITNHLTRHDLEVKGTGKVELLKRPNIRFITALLSAVTDPANDSAYITLLGPEASEHACSFTRRYAVPDVELQQVLKLHLHHQIPFRDILQAAATKLPARVDYNALKQASTNVNKLQSEIKRIIHLATWSNAAHPEFDRVAKMLLQDLGDLSVDLDKKTVGVVLSGVLVRTGAFQRDDSSSTTANNQDLLQFIRWVQSNRLEDASVVELLHTLKQRAATGKDKSLYRKSAQDEELEESNARITVTSIYQAREQGLEFDVVYIPFADAKV
jgi:hypothetical protein